jgi:hypothetical protein
MTRDICPTSVRSRGTTGSPDTHKAKLELFGLFRALRAFWLWIVGLPGFTVETDAKYIKGMLNNPDIQPNATINRWIAGILLFDFDLVHVPADRHTAADGLSR